MQGPLWWGVPSPQAVAVSREPTSEESCHPWFVGCHFLLQTDLSIHRTSPTLLVSLPKSVSQQDQFIGPAGFGLGLSSFSSHRLKPLDVWTAHFVENALPGTREGNPGRGSASAETVKSWAVRGTENEACGPGRL